MRVNPTLLFPCALVLCAQAPSVREVVERFDAAQAKVETLQASFTLTTKRAMLSAPTVSKGTLYLKGAEFVHFAFTPPDDLILHVTAKELISFNPKTKEGESLKIGFIKNANRKFMGLGQKLSYLSDYFQIQLVEGKEAPGTLHVLLSPRALAMRRRYDAIHIWVDKESYLPRGIHWVEKGGDTWQVDLGPLQTNQAIPTAVAGFKPPADAQLREGFSFFASAGRKR